MNDRVKAILLTALKLPSEERAELARTLLETLASDPSETDQLFAEDDAAGGEAGDAPAQPTSDVLAKYLAEI